jgi:hypothetical protein
MAIRYCGDAIITIAYKGYSSKLQADEYVGRITAGGHTWKFDGLCAPRCGFSHAYDSSEAYDKMAKSAVHFGSYYTVGNRGEGVSEGAPTLEIATAIESATEYDEHGERVIRRRKCAHVKAG